MVKLSMNSISKDWQNLSKMIIKEKLFLEAISMKGKDSFHQQLFGNLQKHLQWCKKKYSVLFYQSFLMLILIRSLKKSTWGINLWLFIIFLRIPKSLTRFKAVQAQVLTSLMIQFVKCSIVNFHLEVLEKVDMDDSMDNQVLRDSATLKVSAKLKLSTLFL